MIGRKKEIQRLKNLYKSNKAELVAVYGRRRVGKTYLVNECFKGNILFRHAGLSPVEMDKCYKLVDPFCVFYLKFVKGKDGLDSSFWQKNVVSHQVVTWRGIAFENVCFSHIDQIKIALGINGVSTRQSVWSKRADDEAGTQIDLLIERDDHVVNMCELKFYSGEFVVDKDYHKVLINRQGLLEEAIPRGMIVHSTLVTTYGLKYNEYSGDFDNVITMEDLFR